MLGWHGYAVLMPDAAAVIDEPKRLRRDAERNKQRILRAASELFAERGLDVTLHDVARHAGLGVGTVYRRFANREELIDALFADSLDRLLAAAREAQTIDDPWRAFSMFLERAVEMMATNRGLWTMMTTAASKGDHFLGIHSRLNEVVRDVIARAQAAGALRGDLSPDDMPVLHVILGSGADFLAGARPEIWRRYLGIMLDGLRRDRTAPTQLGQQPPSAQELDHAMKTWWPGKR